MINRQELFRILYRIEEEDYEIIMEPVNVEYDNRLQTPLSFRWREHRYEVWQVLLVDRNPCRFLNYLLHTEGGYYNLALIQERASSGLDQFCSRGYWVLSYRVPYSITNCPKQLMNHG